MRKLFFVAVFCVAPSAFGQNPNLLMYEGFEYAAGLALAPSYTAAGPNDGLQHPPSGNIWFPAGTGTIPIIAEGNIYDAATGLPAPAAGSNNVAFSNATGANGSSARIEIPNMPTGDRTVYWSGFLRVDDVTGLTGAPMSRTPNVNEGGVFLAGFNNLSGAQMGNATNLGALLLLKRASANPDSPRFFNYYLGTAPNGQGADCGSVQNWACATRLFADYDPNLDPAVNPLADGSDLPSAYHPDSANAATRPRFEAVPLAQGETVFVVLSHELNLEGADPTHDDVARLWINPDPSTFGTATPPEPNVISMGAANGSDLTDIESFFLRNHSLNPALSYMDELRIGLTWSSVTGGMDEPPGLPGDYNEDGSVDAADFVVWRKAVGGSEALPNDDTPGVDEDDYNRWVMNFGQTNAAPALGAAAAVPEPRSIMLALLALLGTYATGRRKV